jgi:hypothetical protein
VRKLVERRAIPFKKMGKRVMFDFVELQRWMECFPGVSLEEGLTRGGLVDD